MGATGSARSTRPSASWRARAGVRRTLPRRLPCGSSIATRGARSFYAGGFATGRGGRSSVEPHRRGRRAGSSRRARRGCRPRSLVGKQRSRWSVLSERQRAPARSWGPGSLTPISSLWPERPPSAGACLLRSRVARDVVSRQPRRHRRLARNRARVLLLSIRRRRRRLRRRRRRAGAGRGLLAGSHDYGGAAPSSRPIQAPAPLRARHRRPGLRGVAARAGRRLSHVAPVERAFLQRHHALAPGSESA
jgi:hypothetical protein